MVEMLGRKLNIGDLVLNDMRYAIVIGDNKVMVHTLTDTYEVMRTYKPVYLVTNLQNAEIREQSRLREEYDKVFKETIRLKTIEQQKKVKTKKECNRGSIVNIGPSNYLYLGKARFIDSDSEEYVGHIYLYMYNAHISKGTTESWIKNMSGSILYGDYVESFKKLVGTYPIGHSLSSCYTVCNMTSHYIKVLKSKSNAVSNIIGSYVIQGNEIRVPLSYASILPADIINIELL